MSNELTKATILAADDISLEMVEVPEWGGHLYVRTMDGTARDEYDQEQYEAMTKAREANPDGDTLPNMRARMVASCACDKDSNLLFSMADVVVLAAKSGTALDRVWDVCRRLNRLSAEDIEELAGN